ncbi:MAG: universal stress protein, partial [Chloroflexi bacterium]|nr:universal stress protein [Chloroflexota bacterium]
VLDQQTALQEEYGTAFQTENVVDFVANQEGKQTTTTGSVADRELDKLLTGELEGYPDCLFRDILVAVSHSDSTMLAQEQAMLMNRCSDGSIIGLHVKTESDLATVETEADLENRFYQQLNQRQMQGRFLRVSGDVSPTLQKYSLLSDLVVVKLSYPPGGSLFERISSGVITLLQSSRRPVMFVKDLAARVSRILLVYDESEKSREAFFIAAYYAARYDCELHIVWLDNSDKTSEEAIDFVEGYLSALNLHYHQIDLTGEELLIKLPELVKKYSISTVMMGGYKSTGILGRIFSSILDHVLEVCQVPVLVCQ